MSDEDQTVNVAEVEATEGATSEVEETQQNQVETETTETETSTEETNEIQAPKDNAAWAAMRTENKRLREAVAQSEVDAEYLKELEQLSRDDYKPGVSQQQLQNMDETQRTVAIANENARRAIAEANNNRRQVEDMLAEERYPEMKSNPNFAQIVSERRLLNEMLYANNPSKRKTTLQIAKEVAKQLGIEREQAELVADQKARQQQAERQVAMSESRSASSQGQSTFREDEARIKIAHGDQSYTEKHLKNKYLAGLDF